MQQGLLSSLCRYGNSSVHLLTSASCLGLLVGGRRYIFETAIQSGGSVSGHRKDKKTKKNRRFNLIFFLNRKHVKQHNLI